MADLRFDWDPKTAASNEKKHGITFREAQSVFSDEDALVIPDPDHSQVKERCIILGMSSQVRVLVVVHCFRAEGSVIRIVSARRARTTEQKPSWEKKS